MTCTLEERLRVCGRLAPCAAAREAYLGWADGARDGRRAPEVGRPAPCRLVQRPPHPAMSRRRKTCCLDSPSPERLRSAAGAWTHACRQPTKSEHFPPPKGLSVTLRVSWRDCHLRTRGGTRPWNTSREAELILLPKSLFNTCRATYLFLDKTHDGLTGKS